VNKNKNNFEGHSLKNIVEDPKIRRYCFFNFKSFKDYKVLSTFIGI